MTTDLQTLVQSQLAAVAAIGIAAEPAWRADLRVAGRDAFAAAGWPSKRLEAWKYTDLRPLLKTPWAAPDRPAASLDRAPSLLGDAAVAARLVFVDGRFRAELSRTADLSAGVTLLDLASALAGRPDLLGDSLGRLAGVDADALVALNAALNDSGAVLHVAAGVVLERPVEIVSVTGLGPGSAAWHPRNLIIVEAGAAVDLVELHTGPGDAPAFVNAVTEIRLGDGARLRHYRHQAEGPAVAHVAAIHAVLGRDATYEAFTLTTGARLARTDARIRLKGAGGSCRYSGAYLLDGARHCDNTSEIDLAAPHTSCRQVFKGVLDDQSRGVFQGRIVVQPHAEKVDGHQLSRAILLSDDAEVDQKPELEIWAGDVKCSHGATVGELDRDALFYLRARGLPEAAARRLLIEAFLAEAFEEVGRDDVRAALSAAAAGWMAARNLNTGLRP